MSLDRMIEEIQQEAALSATWTGIARISDRVIEAIRRAPRDRFVPEALKAQAWINAPLPIGEGQTISQPFIVALMTELALQGTAPDQKLARVLEVGAGSGWQAAILASLADQVHAVEIRPALAEQAQKRLQALGFSNVAYHIGDGTKGWPEGAPFDAILVAAATPSILPAWIEQLKTGGRLIAPIGIAGATQMLTLGIKQPDGALQTKQVLPVAFVPLISQHSLR